MSLFAIILFFQILIRFIYCAKGKVIRAWTFNVQRVSKNAEIIIQKIKGTGIFYLMIQNKKQYKSFSSLQKFECNSTHPSCDFISTFLIDISNLPQNFPINPNQSGGNYYFTLYNCHFPVTVESITFSFLNTWGRLPFEKYPLIYICWIESGFYLVLFILCLINSIKHRTIQVLLHYLILGTVFIYTLSVIISGLLFTYANSKNDKLNTLNQNAISIAASVLLCFRNFCLLMLTLFLVSGLSIIYEKIKLFKVFLIIGMSALFALSEFFFNEYLSNTYSFIIYILISVFFIIIYILYSLLLFHLTYHSMNTIDAHMAMIYNSNIDPQTTPTFRKRKLLELCRKCSLSILLIFVLSSILYRMGAFYYFISFLIVEVAMAILLSIICWSCRLRYKMAATYCDDEEAYFVTDNQNQSQDQILIADQNQNMVTFQYQYPTNPDQMQDQPQNNSENQVIANSNGKNEGKTKSQSQGQLDGQSQKIAASLTAQNDTDKVKEDDDLSLSSMHSINGGSDDGFESDKTLRTQRGENGAKKGENNTSNENQSGENTLRQWEYGMMLPPMPQEDFTQNQVHPKD